MKTANPNPVTIANTNAKVPAMKRIAITLAILVAALLSVVSLGATLDWDPAVSGAPGNGSGTWDQTVANTNWWDGVGGSNTSWSNAALHDARFAVVDNSGSIYDLTLGENIVANSIFLVNGNVTYVFGGAGVSLTTGGITVNNSKKLQLDVPVTLSASQSWAIQGSAAITANQPISGTGFSLGKGSAGTLTLNANNTFDGGFSMSQGAVVVGHDSAFGSGAINLNGGTGGISATGGTRTIGNDIATFLNTTKTYTFGGTEQMEFTGTLTLQAAVVDGVLVLNTTKTGYPLSSRN